MKISYHGHSSVKIETQAGKTILIDPFISGNPLCDLRVEDLKPDIILISHAHSDHFGDCIELAKDNDALVISVLELTDFIENQGIRVHGLQAGGGYNFDFGRVTLTQAIHGSSMEIDGKPYTLGLAAGIILEIEGKTIYHLGDTALFSDLKMYGDLYGIDLAFIPIGDNFTMGPEHAAIAASWLKAKKVMPIHYNTFPLIEQDPITFTQSLPDNQGLYTEIGQVFEL